MFRLFSRALPLLFLFVFVFLLTGEVWIEAGGMSGVRLAATCAFLVLIGVIFLAARIPDEVRSLVRDPDLVVWCRSCEGSPMEPIAGWLNQDRPEFKQYSQALHDGSARAVKLDRPQWVNIILVLLVSEAVQVVLVTATVFVFLVAFGAVAVDLSTTEAYLGHPPHVLWSLSFLGQSWDITEELLQVAAFLAFFSGLYFTIVSSTDATYRESFSEDVTAEVAEAIGVRGVYLYVHDELVAEGVPVEVGD